MNLKAIIATLVLGTSSVALAAPSNPAFAPQVRDHRGDRGDRRMPPRFERWQQIATGSLVRGRDLVRVNATKIDKLKLELVGPGSMFVDKLVISFGNGRSQTIEVDAWVTARAGTAALDIKGENRSITSIAVYGRGQSSGFRAGASFKLLAI
jgi:hypothetical protein